jgi:hypothetical protein
VPWSCCGEELSDDAPECPSCGKAKARWTVRFDRTRVFNLGALEWDVETLDYTPDDEASEAEAELDEDWELERVDALPGDEDQPADFEPLEGPRRKDVAEEDEDWELEGVEALPGDSDAGSAGDVEGRALSRRETGAAQAQAEDPDEAEDEEWELEALEHADAND